ncbi:MAG TPA: hypothetical protein VFV93_17220 [Thermomicrobiales bacterium]|nr:hypothetical protein [Thermomicrobiales bacterium]
MATVTTRQLTIQIPEEAYAWLEQEARDAGQPIEVFAGLLVEEARRVEQFSGIFFRRGGGDGRRAVIIGGMDVWEMIMLYQAHGREGMLEAFDSIQEFEIDQALAYYEAHPEDIDERLWENSQPMEYWLEKYPELRAQVREI